MGDKFCSSYWWNCRFVLYYRIFVYGPLIGCRMDCCTCDVCDLTDANRRNPCRSYYCPVVVIFRVSHVMRFTACVEKSHEKRKSVVTQIKYSVLSAAELVRRECKKNGLK